MITRRLFFDILAMLAALAVLALTTLLLPSFWPIWLRGLIGLMFGSIVFAIYLVARPPDEIIALQRQLETTAVSASKIQQAAGKLIPLAKSFRLGLLEVSTGIAQLEVKILRRELLPLATEIRRLESLANNFLSLTMVLTGEVYLRPPELQAKLEELRKQHLPETLQTLQELNAVLDESRAKQLASAEEELEILAQLYDQNSAARNAAEILRQVLEVAPQSAQGGENVS
jgi:hypothetical protein